MSSSLDRLVPAVDGGFLEAVASALRHPGYVVVPDALPGPVLDGLLAEFDRDGPDFAPAGIGRDDDRRRVDRVRRDRIRWLDPDRPATDWYFRWIESLRLGLNRSLFLGLFDYECHLAWYPPGAYYRTHLDAFRGQDNRKVSTVVYLNPEWRPVDGGELVIYEPGPEPASDPVVARIVRPDRGVLVLFLSEEFPHEVLAAAADRYSLTGWFRVNASSVGSQPDPPVFAPETAA